MDTLTEVARGARSLVEGMRVTLRNLFRKPVTVEYPRKRAVISKRQRNAIVLIEKEEMQTHNCIACLQCEKICPSDCIKITPERVEGIPFKRPAEFKLSFAECSECGLCLAVCPTDTLGYAKNYDSAGYRRDDFNFDLVDAWRDSEEETRERLREAEARKKAEREAKRKADAEAKAKAKAEAEAQAEAKQPEPGKQDAARPGADATPSGEA